jgi:hypothetical protein
MNCQDKQLQFVTAGQNRVNRLMEQFILKNVNNYWETRIVFHLSRIYTGDHALLIATLVPISPTFYEQLLRQNPFAKKLPTQIVSTLKLCKELWYDCQFHQHFTSSFFIPKFFAHLLCAYNLGL